MQDKLAKASEMFDRHLKAKPSEVQKPESKLNENDQKTLNDLDEKLREIDTSIEDNRKQLTQINCDIDALLNLVSDIDLLESSIVNINEKLQEAVENTLIRITNLRFHMKLQK